MRKIFIPNIEDIKLYKERIINDKNYVFYVKNNNIIIGLMNCGHINPLINIFLEEIENIKGIDIQEKYSIINELLEPFDFGLRYSKKEL